MTQDIKTMGELYKEVNHIALKSVCGGFYIGITFGIGISMLIIHRYTDVDLTLFIWTLGLGILGFIFGIGLIIKSGVQFRIKQ